MFIFPPPLRSGVPFKTSLTLGSANVSATVTCGGSGLIIFVVYAIFNSAFLVGSLASNEISVVEDSLLRGVMISFADYSKNYPALLLENCIYGVLK